MAKVAVIVVAAGRSERFGGKEKKIFAKVDGQPVFLRALQLFVNREDVCQTLLVVAPEDLDQMKTKFGANLGFMGVKLVTGGAHRHESVKNALAEVAADAEFVAVHDAARVCVAEPWIDHIFETAFKTGAAAPVLAVTSTLKRVDGEGKIGPSVPREGLYLSQTPQAFRKDVLVAAYGAMDASAAPTDDVEVVTASGVAVKAVEGDARNIKITTQGDLSLSSAMLKTLPHKAVSKRGAFEEAQW
jgi:2-C-methyl-D-erythritol 4-phosphate cytidylyltransferase